MPRAASAVVVHAAWRGLSVGFSTRGSRTRTVWQPVPANGGMKLQVGQPPGALGKKRVGNWCYRRIWKKCSPLSPKARLGVSGACGVRGVSFGPFYGLSMHDPRARLLTAKAAYKQ